MVMVWIFFEVNGKAPVVILITWEEFEFLKDAFDGQLEVPINHGNPFNS